MKELVERIVQALVDSPEEVDVQEVERSNPKLLEIRVSKKDMRKVIGAKGENIDAVRRIVSVAGKGRRYMVKVLPGGPSDQRKICKGKIKRLLEDRNYGFIEADDGRAVYFHGSSLRGVGLHSLSLDQPVKFEVVKGSQGFKALKVVPTPQLVPIGKSIDSG
ncbi:MAG: KH domain-containing protein [Proteobacteria bacterium]|nr:KH domain-containing protein [Pseudomonadota bacterium]